MELRFRPNIRPLGYSHDFFKLVGDPEQTEFQDRLQTALRIGGRFLRFIGHQHSDEIASLAAIAAWEATLVNCDVQNIAVREFRKYCRLEPGGISNARNHRLTQLHDEHESHVDDFDPESEKVISAILDGVDDRSASQQDICFGKMDIDEFLKSLSEEDRQIIGLMLQGYDNSAISLVLDRHVKYVERRKTHLRILIEERYA